MPTTTVRDDHGNTGLGVEKGLEDKQSSSISGVKHALETAAFRQSIKKRTPPPNHKKGQPDDDSESDNDDDDTLAVNSEKIPLEDRISTPKPCDIVFGRGRPYQMHEGNQVSGPRGEQHPVCVSAWWERFVANVRALLCETALLWGVSHPEQHIQFFLLFRCYIHIAPSIVGRPKPREILSIEALGQKCHYQRNCEQNQARGGSISKTMR
jgi:hypothetical protein